jgi:hypothetical protein
MAGDVLATHRGLDLGALEVARHFVAGSGSRRSPRRRHGSSSIFGMPRYAPKHRRSRCAATIPIEVSRTRS